MSGNPIFTLQIGGTPFKVVRFFGHEAISSLFEFRLEVAGRELEPDEWIGQPALLKIAGAEEPRCVHGLVSEAEYIGLTRSQHLYEVTIAPWAHRLLHRVGVRLFQDKTTEQIITEVLTRAGLPTEWFRFSLVEAYVPRNYCVQYRETDLAFISRLMEEDGIFYFFEHEQDRHVWVMADHARAHTPIAGDPAVWFNPPMGDFVQDREHVRSFRFGGRVRPGKVLLRDKNLHKPDQKMEVFEETESGGELEVYDYPGEYQDPGHAGPHQGKLMAKIRLESLQATRRTGHGESDCPRLVPGKLMGLVGHPRLELNGEYRLLRVNHTGSQPQVLDQDTSGESSYNNTFVCNELKVPYRPPRMTPRPVMRGLQTASVVGPEGEEVHVDEEGRVRVQFHWDREGEHDERSTCWVRVAQLWAGDGWGAMFIPRIGHEVLIDFLEGDPDRPILVGRIYHGRNRPPYALPEQKTKSTIKSDSSIGGGGFNEFRFEDRKGGEQIFIHAERNMDVRVNNDSFTSVSNNRHETIGHDKDGKAGDSFVQMFRDHHVTIDRHTRAHLGGDVELLVGGKDGPGQLDLHVKHDLLELVDGARHEHTLESVYQRVDGSVSREIGGSEQVKIGTHLGIEAKNEVFCTADKIVLDAGAGLTISAGGNFITINSQGIYLSGTKIYLNSGGSALAGTPVTPAPVKDARDAAPKAASPAEAGSVSEGSGNAERSPPAVEEPWPPGTVGHKTPKEADTLIRKHLAKCAKTGIDAGKKIEGSSSVIGEPQWSEAGIAHYGKQVWNAEKKDSLNGFVDGQGKVWIHKDRGNPATMIHEGIHKYSDQAMLKKSQPLNEGMTEYFTRHVAGKENIAKTRRNYEANYKTAQALAKLVGQDQMCSAYFGGDVDAMKMSVDAKQGAGTWDNFVKATQAQKWDEATKLVTPVQK